MSHWFFRAFSGVALVLKHTSPRAIVMSRKKNNRYLRILFKNALSLSPRVFSTSVDIGTDY